MYGKPLLVSRSREDGSLPCFEVIRKSGLILTGLIALAFAQCAGGGTIGLQWDPVTNDPRISGYEVHYGVGSGQYGSMTITDANGAATNTAAVQDLTPGTTYYLAVRARNLDGSLVSAFSNQVNAGGFDHNWSTVSTTGLASVSGLTGAAVLIAGVPTRHDSEPGVVRARNVSTNGFDMRFQEWDYLDGIHTPEQIHYLVAEAGIHTLAGLNVQAGKLDTAGLGRAGQWAQVNLSQSFMSPAVLAGVQSDNGVDPVTTRLRDLDFSGFDIAMDEQESKADGHIPETLGWIAIEEGSGRIGDGRLIQVFQDTVDSNFQPILFSPTARRYGTVVATTDSYNSMDPVFIRHRNVEADRIELSLQEEQSVDTETLHPFEQVGVFVGE